jgi:hypothetical protein
MNIVIVAAVAILVTFIALLGKSDRELEEEFRKERAYFEEFRNKF